MHNSQKTIIGIVATTLLLVLICTSAKDTVGTTLSLNSDFRSKSFEKISNENMFGAAKTAVSTSVSASKNILNIFTSKALPLFYLEAPNFSFLPLKKLPTYQIQPLQKPAQKIETTKQNPIYTTPSVSTPPNPLGNALATFVPKSSNIENSVFNIFCSQKLGKLRKTITGSGILISDDGTLLTNAHVAQFPLVSEIDQSVVCLARTGASAEKTFGLKTVFISPEWSAKNAPYINNGGTAQTGESDYALLKLVSSTDLQVSPIRISYNPVSPNDSVTLIAYPADILSKNINAGLTRQKEVLKLLNYYKFSPTQANTTSNSSGNINSGADGGDIFQTSESSLAQHGSSGGQISNRTGDLVGVVSIITTSPTEPSKNRIRAITPSHINSELSKYYPDGLLHVAQNGSAQLNAYFDKGLRVKLSSLFLKHLSH